MLLVLAFGRGVLNSGIETVLRWPFAVLLAAGGLGLLFNYAPKRRQPSSPVPLNLPSGGAWCLRVLSCQARFVLGL
jgi:hypothetical protein